MNDAWWIFSDDLVEEMGLTWDDLIEELLWHEECLNGGEETDKALKKKVKSRSPDSSDGMMCKQCKKFYPYAEANQEDGTLMCYACRNNL